MLCTRFAPAAVSAVLFSLPLAAQRTAALADGFTTEVEVERLPILSQGRTGTCWSFATVSFLEAELQRLHGEQVDLSEMYGVYWAYVEKATRYVRLHGHAQFSQGGLSHDVIAIARAHGIAPAGAYSGLPEGAEDHNHDALEAELKKILEPFAKGRGDFDAMVAAVRGVLDRHLGPVPESFAANGVEVTPLQFATETLKLPLDEYVELMSFRSAGFDRRAELLVPDNWMRFDGYWNLRIDELLANVDHALREGFSVALDCDLSERSNGGGTAKLSPEMEATPITDDLRQQDFDARRTTDDHLMHIVGIAKGPDGGTWYLVKNSWGDRGPFGGHMMMSRAYLAAKTVGVMLHRDGLLPETRERIDAAAPH